MRGAGGNSGGLVHFFMGIAMMCGGFYMLFNAITVSSHFGLGYRLYSYSGYGITGGMVLIPLIFGIGMIFYNSKNIFGWVLALGALVALVFGVLSSVRFNLRTMSSFDLIVILVLSVGGLGLFIRSLQNLGKEGEL